MLNKTELIGRLGNNPEVKTFENGSKVVTFSLATSEKWKDKASGEVKEETEWHNIQVWRGLADVCEKYLTKGSLVYLQCKKKTRSYQNNEGQNLYVVDMIANQMIMLDTRTQSNQTPKPESQDLSSFGENPDVPF